MIILGVAARKFVAEREAGMALTSSVRSENSRWRAQPRRMLGLAEMVRRAVLAALAHDALMLAQATAYSAMVALFPALIVAAAVVALLPEAQPLRFQLSVFFDRVLPSNVSPLLDAYFASSHRNPNTARVLLGSLAVSITGATSVMATLMEGFRRAHDLPLVRGSFWPRRVRALALVPLSLLPMTAVSVLVVFGHLITHWLVAAVTPELRSAVDVFASLLRWVLALAGSVGIIAVIYHLGTDVSRHVGEELAPLLREPWSALRKDWSWRASLPGAALATLLWFVTTLGFGFYVTRFANYSRVYGSLGAAIALMFWLYIIALSVLIGGEFNAQRAAAGAGAETGVGQWEPPGVRRRTATRRTGRIAD
jgi:membrane protein